MIYREKTSTKGYDLNKTPSEMTQQELYLEIARLSNENDKLKRTKKFGLVWENKNDAKVEEVRRSAPILVEDSSKRVINDPNDVNHVLINGDNFQAMTALRATHAGKVDVIYIDPPYNTGNKDFIYNDKFVDAEDGYRHSLWLSFMQKRLILARELLSETGVIFVSIDDNEQARLKLLMDDIFGAQNFVSNSIVENNPKGRKNSSFLSGTHEYCLIYVKSKQAYSRDSLKFNQIALNNVKDSRIIEQDEIGLYKKGKRQIIGKNSNPRAFENPNRAFTIYFIEKTGNIACVNEYDEKTDSFLLSEVGENLLLDGAKRYCPIESKSGKPNTVTYTKEKVMELHSQGDLIFLKDSIYQKERNFTQRLKSIISDTSTGRSVISETAGKRFAEISGNGVFDFPKSVGLILTLISLHPNPNAIVLDFFAGSGTTAHAVAELNKEDGGKRQCILITDGGKTETTGESSKNASETTVNIAEEITYERVKRVLTGENWADGKEHEPLGGNLFYLNTVVKYVGTIDAKSKEPHFCPSNSTAFSLDTGLWHPILEEVGVSAEYPYQEHDYKLFALPKGEDGKQNYALTINATDWEFTAFKEWFDKNMPEDSTVFLYADNYSHGGCEWMEELEMAKVPRLAEVNITKRLVNNHNWVAHSCLKTDI